MEAFINKKGVKLNEPSVESPYTSLGSDGSYNVLLSSKNHTNGIRTAAALNRTDFTMPEPLHRNDITAADPLNHIDVTAQEALNRTDITAPPLHTSSLLLGPHVNNTTILPTYTRSLSNTSYLSLRAKAEQGHAKYESRTKAVMDALQGLQNKIRKIESDRSNAEMNLKCLALETRDYKELLKLKEKLGGDMDAMLKESQSKELENQLEHAQDRCNALEKQLETMRKVMTLQPGTAKTTTSKSTTKTTPTKVLPVSTPVNVNTKTTETGMNGSGSTDEMKTPTNEAEKTLVAAPSPNTKPTNDTLLIDTSAIEKLNGLEQEHKRLTAMQSKTEDKINKLDAKIRKETYHRKLLQDQTNQLHTVITNPKERVEEMEENSTYEQPVHPQQVSKMKRKKSAPARNTSDSKTSKPTNDTKCSVSHSSSDKPQTSSSSPSHYLVDFAQIPFVVGRSTSKSHSLGANIQSVLSIMKSHNMLCCDASPASCRRGGGRGGGHANKCVGKQSELLRSCEHLHELLATLQDEFAQLGFEHREAITQLQSSSTRGMRTMLTKQKEKIVERMETKEKQINIIREHLHKVQASQGGAGGGGLGGEGGGGKKRQLRKNRITNTTRKGGGAAGSGTPASAASTVDGKLNPKLDMYKKVKKIQSTLCKGDLKWV